MTDQISDLQNENEKLNLNITEKEESLGRAKISIMNFEQDLSNTRQQLMASQMHITELKESHSKMLAEKDTEIESLQRQVNELKVDVDENAAFRAQVLF